MDLSTFSYSHIYWIFLLPLIGAGADIVTGLALYYDRASKAVTSTQFTGVALTLTDEDGNIIENKYFDTLYVENNEEE